LYLYPNGVCSSHHGLEQLSAGNAGWKSAYLPHAIGGSTKRKNGRDFLMLETIKDLGRFILKRKKFVLAPIFLTLLLLGALIVLAQGTAVAPFVYTIF
jgi:hypothetical protein